MKILRHCYKTAQSLVSILSCPAVNCLADTLAQSLVTIDASLLANFSTWANDRDVGQHVEEDLGAAIGCRRVIVTYVHSVAVALAPHSPRESNLWQPKDICDIKIVKTVKIQEIYLVDPSLELPAGLKRWTMSDQDVADNNLQVGPDLLLSLLIQVKINL